MCCCSRTSFSASAEPSLSHLLRAPPPPAFIVGRGSLSASHALSRVPWGVLHRVTFPLPRPRASRTLKNIVSGGSGGRPQGFAPPGRAAGAHPRSHHSAPTPPAPQPVSTANMRACALSYSSAAVGFLALRQHVARPSRDLTRTPSSSSFSSPPVSFFHAAHIDSSNTPHPQK